ncbi:hypothetical protein DFQ28_006039 [Apophysomyces sp. BC1034]|nr:hypothetical protein DFQ30_006033 [Apophysomyces sp. BC1015]KAG0177339.1 hypothetical protein DFQ29_004940 [Apophysomyces sp. BC1021]KAG0187658.1 hypothetical protein DFQ28_006039 [Apophysomyces sp. BC1034]
METTQRFSFQYFDQESDFGVEDENGERIRKRKRPGRKPNPPSVHARRAQNREAQKAFREREQLRRQEKEQQWVRDAKELIDLRQCLSQAEYEIQYLKGYMLHMSKACINQFGVAPQLERQRSVDPESTVTGIPSMLKSMLDSKEHHIISLTQTEEKHQPHRTSPESAPSSCPLMQKPKLSPIYGTISEAPVAKTAGELADLPPLQALHLIRLQLKIGNILGDRLSIILAPTELQRTIPHDMRIDYVPHPAMRDRCIIFQGLYDIDECFQFLTTTTLFCGGDVTNGMNWLLHPKFNEKYWFLSHAVIESCIPTRYLNDDSTIWDMSMDDLQK